MIRDIARICHEVNRAWCEFNGDLSQVAWDKAPDWQKESMVRGVEFVLANPTAHESAQHDAWMRDKVAEGWVHGTVKDANKRTHPCIVPYEELPDVQQFKDKLFRTVVIAYVESK